MHQPIQKVVYLVGFCINSTFAISRTEITPVSELLKVLWDSDAHFIWASEFMPIYHIKKVPSNILYFGHTVDIIRSK